MLCFSSSLEPCHVVTDEATNDDSALHFSEVIRKRVRVVVEQVGMTKNKHITYCFTEN